MPSVRINPVVQDAFWAFGKSKGRGVGLRNTNERLKALYDNDFSVNIDLIPLGGLRTTIELPCEYSSSGNGYPMGNQDRLSENEYKAW